MNDNSFYSSTGLYNIAKDMKTILLKRIATDVTTGTQGVLIDEMRVSEPNRIIQIPFAVTLERPWLNNQPNVSCIPSGVYNCKRIISPRFGETFEIFDVPNRYNILFHWGSYKEDSEGCILVAEKFSFIENQFMVQESKTDPNGGFNEFMKRLEGVNTAKLVIEKCYFE
jgi:hypothetical protein